MSLQGHCWLSHTRGGVCNGRLNHGYQSKLDELQY